MIDRLKVKIRALLRKSEVERELEEELRYHLDKDIERNIGRGMSYEAARRLALQGFGGVQQIKEQSRGARGTRMPEQLWQDLRYGARRLRKNPGFTAITLVTLGLGIGATTAIFSVVNSVLLQPLAYRDPGRLVLIWSNNLKRGDGRGPVSAADFVDWQAMNSSLSEIAAFHSQPHNLDVGASAERVGGVSVSGNLFSLLGASPLIGRTFTASDDSPASPKVTVISYALWQRLFAASPGSVGSTIKLDGESHTVIGVMPSDFAFPRRNELPPGYQVPETPDLWIPLALTADQARNRGRHYLVAIGRLKGNVTIGQAQADLAAVAGQLAAAYPASNMDQGARVAAMRAEIVGGIRTPLLVLLAAVLMVLFIACANVASITLARTVARGREIGIRVALGAGRRRLFKQLLTESLMTYCLAAGLGIGMAFVFLYGLLVAAPKSFPRIQDAAISAPVLLFSLVISLVTSVVFGLAPAVQASRTGMSAALKEGGSVGSSPGRRSMRFREGLIIAELAISVVLLVGSGLLIKSFVTLMSVDPGFVIRNVIAMDVGLSRSKYAEPGRQAQYFENVLERVAAIPGVSSAAAVYPLPLSGAEEGMGISIDGKPPLLAGQRRGVNPVWVTPDYFKTLGINLVRGRSFTIEDGADAPQVAVINQTLARRYFEGEDPIAQHLTIGWQGEKPRAIVGIVADTRPKGLDQDARPEVYVPYMQWPSAFMSVVIRADSPPPGLLPTIREEIRAVDPEQPVFNVTSLDALLARSVAERRFIMLIVGVFAAVALTIASVGLYGVMSYAVVQRTREIGIRMALGAGNAGILGMLMVRGGVLVAAGVLLGLSLSAMLARLISSLLYGISGTDLATYTAICLTLAVIAGTAIYIPTRRATSIDPTVTLRYE